MTEERLVLVVEIGQICGKGLVYGGALVMACVMHIALFINNGFRGKILDIIKSMHSSVKSKVKFSNNLGNEFMCSLGGRQGTEE